MLEWVASQSDLAGIQRDALLGKQPALDTLNSAPKLHPWEEQYWELFGLLRDERPVAGMGLLLPIPVTAIIALCDFYDFTKPEIEEAIRVIRAMDRAELAIINKPSGAKPK